MFPAHEVDLNATKHAPSTLFKHGAVCPMFKRIGKLYRIILTPRIYGQYFTPTWLAQPSVGWLYCSLEILLYYRFPQIFRNFTSNCREEFAILCRIGANKMFYDASFFEKMNVQRCNTSHCCEYFIYNYWNCVVTLTKKVSLGIFRSLCTYN